MTITVESWLKQAKAQLTEAGSSSPQIDAEVLLLHVLDKPRSFLFTWPEHQLDSAQVDMLNDMLARRETGEPVAYITGVREFWSLPLKVSPTTLIPRPDTERLVELALAKISSSPVAVLDLGTGTGAIALALASERPDCRVIGVDLRHEAVALATENGQQLGISNCHFQQGSWFSSLKAEPQFGVIVSNPPYIDPHDPHLTQGDVRFEPASALIAQEKGMADIRLIASQARNYLTAGGWLMFEHGYDQGVLSRHCLQELGYAEVRTEQDYAGQDRVTMGRWKG
ncbi:peptide chain release factor N(5)-glutamine methyltransferase [Thaumasiovibrio sp. DFM-14]|uniref:peptide chain release factor N(5)-glutamine methyltransferase n=1 Tax=Thaumasiovibrio sp. DFM-14 TaxID=3384792 RepID=UPI0039A13676